jgi:hypothetical protein
MKLEWEQTYPYEERATMFPSALADWLQENDFQFEHSLGPFQLAEGSKMYIYVTQDKHYVYTCNYIHEDETMELYHAYLVRQRKKVN